MQRRRAMHRHGHATTRRQRYTRRHHEAGAERFDVHAQVVARGLLVVEGEVAALVAGRARAAPAHGDTCERRLARIAAQVAVPVVEYRALRRSAPAQWQRQTERASGADRDAHTVAGAPR